MIYTIQDLARDFRAPYAWPGGYPRYFITSDGAALSFEAVGENYAIIADDIRTGNTRSEWHVCGCEINWEDPDLYCDHTGKRIESAYAEDQADGLI